MSDSNVKFGQGGRLNSDATRDSSGLPWNHDGSEDQVDPLPNRVVPKTKSPTVPPPASTARSGSLRGYLSTTFELCGLGLLCWGAFVLSPALGLIVAGIVAIIIGLFFDGGAN